MNIHHFRFRTWFNILSTCFVFYLSSCSNKTDETDIEGIISRMSIKQKIDMLGGFNTMYIRGYDSLGIPKIRMSDATAGITSKDKSTAYPAPLCLAASWNKDLAYKMGESLAKEAKAENIDIMLAPAMNIYRAPMCGRNFEYLGEDPFLAGKIASAYIKGMQNQGIAATAKHYVANNQDYDRRNISSDIDERTLREIYLPAFERCVKEAEVACIMSAYNLVNGIHCSEHDKLLNGVLKGEWGFKGFVMSDWVSTYDGLACALGGLDLEMPSAQYMNYDTLAPFIENGKLPEESNRR
ncbi:MAG: glycoside hydrolase family 3 protein [Bacteroidales bacterium]|nr:glycoside hydrolase family 3 protein [Bacteroidales bacterium]